MNEGSEPVDVLEWIKPVLENDAALAAGLTGGWHTYPLPAGVRSPFGMVRMHTSAADLTGLQNGQVIWTPIIFQVNLYDREHANWQRLKPLARRVFALLHGTQGQTADAIIYDVYRVQIDADKELNGQITEAFITQQFAIDVKSI